MIKNNKLLSYNRTEIKSDNGILFIWYEKDCDEIVATIEVVDGDCGEVWINRVYVAPDYRGNKLVYDLLDYAVLFGGTKLAVRKRNQIAIRCYIEYLSLIHI